MKSIYMVFAIFCTPLLYAQDDVKMHISTKVNDQNMQQIMDFEGINLTQFNFENKNLQNAFYALNIKEFKDGNLIETYRLFDGSESPIFQLDSSIASFNIITKISDGEFSIGLRTSRFASKKLTFPLYEDTSRYALKDFTLNSNTLHVSLTKPIHLLAIITPKMNPDGSGSYCEVAQSGVTPELLGKEFDIPHYFLVEMQFYTNKGANSKPQ
ncbi:hypothetical protein [Flavimarina sp. Hel_I_48]|uniref:hypothetical protein n=1 Tax=Flavimarina sp. Hel_I_48 TaxID=1392488 RepID=UPI00069029AB|nr:hypothetical protein [Flavimarina sp. Hel_I_48]